MQEAFMTAFLADPAISQKVAGRIAWGVQPDGSTVLPYINLHVVGAVPRYSLDGRSSAKAYRVQVDLYDRSQTGVVDLAGAVEALADGFPSDAGITAVFIQSERGVSPDRDAAGRVTFGASFDLQLKFVANGV